jgi:hypothetical protein
VIHMQSQLYGIEYDYGVAFETYVAQGLNEFYEHTTRTEIEFGSAISSLRHAHLKVTMDTYVQAVDEKRKAQSKVVKMLLPGIRKAAV